MIMPFDAILFKMKTIVVDCIPYNVEYFYFPEQFVPKFGYVACASNGHQLEKIFDFQPFIDDFQEALDKVELILDKKVIQDISEILAKRVSLLSSSPIYIRESPDVSTSLLS